MIASRISGIVLAAAVLALSASATRATIVAVNGGGNTPHAAPKQPDSLSDLPQPTPSPKLASPQPGGQASGYNLWRANFGRSASPSATNGPALRHGPALKR